MGHRVLDVLKGSERRRITDGVRWAAVLIPLYEKRGEFFIVLTKRTDNLRDHSGQISFPGGTCQEVDIDVEATALREAFEEVGIKPKDVRVIGMLDDEKSKSSGYVVTPVVGVIPHPYRFTVNRNEVDSLIEVPIVALSEAEGKDGVEYWYKGYRIWGLTARVLKQLLGLI